MAVGCSSSKHKHANGFALDFSALFHTITFTFPWLEKHPELSRCLVHLRHLSVTKQGPVIRSQDDLLRSFRVLNAIRSMLGLTIFYTCCFQHTWDSTNQRKTYLPPIILFFPEYLENKDSIIRSHGAEVKDFTKKCHEKIETMYRKPTKPKKVNKGHDIHRSDGMPVREIAWALPVKMQFYHQFKLLLTQTKLVCLRDASSLVHCCFLGDNI